ncbi:hypothetical protein HCA69_10025 [Listeria grandensis]|uniref:Uncharacterized protein n=1 Tax=Listeria grandensis TaxID=1494963 RepID=A0A7X0Y4D0_9LIST|nr:phosphoribosyltransferase [Listeria grandensis]MBC1936704.1 hypothetical protein [Listeria grandensis]
MKEVTLTSNQHFGRTVSGVEISSMKEVDKAIDKGCSIQGIKYILRNPEVMICDLSNLEYPLSTCTENTILKCFEYIQANLDKKLFNTTIKKIYGEGLVTEIAICGPSVRDLDNIKQEILEEAYKELEILTKVQYSLYDAKGIERIREVDKISSRAMIVQNELLNYYKSYVWEKDISNIKIFNIKKVYQNHRIWSDIRSLGTNKLFILNAGLQLALAYINSTGDKNIYFSEFHRENDPYEQYKKMPFNEIFPKISNDESVVVVDKMYTGGTIRLAVEQLQKEGIQNIITVGLFPKAFKSLITVDYFVFAGKLYETKEVLHKLSEDNWHKELILGLWDN